MGHARGRLPRSRCKGDGVSTDIPEWVRLDCRSWGHQKRRIWSGRDWHGNVDGYAQSLLGRIRDEREGAGQGARVQRWPEVFWGGGLDVQRALLGMPERPYSVLHLHYVWDPEWNITAKRKARVLELNPDVYYDNLDRAETWLWARLEVRSDTQAAEAVTKVARDSLRAALENVTKAQPRATAPCDSPDFSALNRKIVSLPR